MNRLTIYRIVSYMLLPVGVVLGLVTVAALFFALNNVAQGRVKLVGGNVNSTASNRIRLRIVYSKL